MLEEGTQDLLPVDNIYNIQIGTQTFKISGLSLNSDAPSFFTDYFIGKADKADQVMFVDRSANVFEKIYLHLQGYAIRVDNEMEYSLLFSDAVYYHLPKLLNFLIESDSFFTNISGESFRIPKNLFSRKGDSPNYFHMTSIVDNINYKNYYERSVAERRPLIIPAHFVSRSPEYFKDLLSLLTGASIKMNDERRESLIKECRYYMLLNLEQRLIKSKIIFNPLTNCEDIILNLSDLKKNGVELDAIQTSKVNSESTTPTTENEHDRCSDERSLKRARLNKNAETEKLWHIIEYKRPYLDDDKRSLIFQINTSETSIYINLDKKVIHLVMVGETKKQFEQVFGPALDKAGVPLTDYKMRVPFSKFKTPEILALPACFTMCKLLVNDSDCPCISTLITDLGKNQDIPWDKKRERIVDLTNMNELSCSNGLRVSCNKSLWKLGVNKDKLIVLGVRAQVYSNNKEFCKSIDFL
ncbi:hypothetical protein TPHA_0C00970 [Tetrapisispora phaffii CBS 4417]|uniref:Potassium channel tetramerisation-type BTB domain-containing protein n=1 Tax=Tetrapisispora phaffii (strain ATCC 24235 / CBS 4417 / NBRC 1672 / NRRL Y-8282 / UCD 70-5) TaxID=1071381 RepID=G8BR77_TETPH|nr:hypothetical protein TPHA_0C00970 [Tetrapisispora phaffii CBS 4417]CCE62253.1 hypothetical protein TPHA_0C00970 [Tetrapisispora phaffii CBS 4417]